MIEFSSAGALFAATGLVTLAAALLPRVLGHAPISMPMVFLAAGIAGFAWSRVCRTQIPQAYGSFAVHLIEVCVIVSLMAAGWH